MAHARDLYKTKLCTLFQRGNCPRQSCSFAHGEADLRRFPGTGGFNGWQENHRSGDLRDRLERRASPTHCRRSPTRDGKARQGTHLEWKFSPADRGQSNSRSPARHRDSRSYTPPRSPFLKSKKRDSKKFLQVEDAHLSDVSGNHYDKDNCKNCEDGNLKSFAMSPSPCSGDVLQEQLCQVQHDNETLIDEKESLERTLGKKVEEASILTTQNTDLESKLVGSQEEYRRWGSKMKRLIKVYMRCTRAQEELKKMQSKLQKMAEEFLIDEGRRPIAHVDDSDFYNLTDGEPERLKTGINAEVTDAHRTKNYLEIEANIVGQSASKNVIAESVAMAKKRRLHSIREKTLSSIQIQQNSSTLEQDLEHPPAHQNPRLTLTSVTEKSSKVDMFRTVDVRASKERRTGSDTSLSPRSSSVEKIRGRDIRLNLPHTGLAAHARDFQHESELEEHCSKSCVVEREDKILNLNMPPSKFFQSGICLSQHLKYQGNKEDADYDGLGADMDEHAVTLPSAGSGQQAVAVDN